MKFFTENLNLIVTVVGAVGCLIPLTFLGPQSRHLMRDLSLEGKNVDLHPIILGFFFITIIPMTDLLLDVPRLITSYLCPVETFSKCSIESRSIVRLTDFERLLFLLGMANQSTIWFMPASTDLQTLGAVSICLWNCNQILLLGPILVFLQRCTTTYTERRTFVVLFSGTLGVFLRSSVGVLDMHTYDNALRITAEGLSFFSGAGYALLILICAVKYAWHHIGSPLKRQNTLAWLRSRTYKWRVSDVATPCSSSSDDELYSSYIPAVHMMSSALLASAAVNDKFSDRSMLTNHLVTVVISLASQILVLVVELRIRKNEIARGLVRSDIETSAIIFIAYSNTFSSRHPPLRPPSSMRRRYTSVTSHMNFGHR